MDRPISFSKMHGLGNDFVIINNLDKKINIDNLPISQLANRHLGIGFDQLLVIEPSKTADFYCRIINSDGSEAEQCGNGLRCVARFIKENGLDKRTKFSIETKAGVFPIAIQDFDRITIEMGAPLVEDKQRNLRIDDENRHLSIISLGNPHCVLKVESLSEIDIQTLGKTISTHDYFPNGTNVGFMEVSKPNEITLRTYERGAGQTLACGSNACAAAITAILNNWATSPVTVHFAHGSLKIEWKGEDNPILMTGPATYVFSGQIR